MIDSYTEAIAKVVCEHLSAEAGDGDAIIFVGMHWEKWSQDLKKAIMLECGWLEVFKEEEGLIILAVPNESVVITNDVKTFICSPFHQLRIDLFSSSEVRKAIATFKDEELDE